MTEKRKKSGEISRREFLRDAGLLVGGTAIGSTVLLAACGGGGATETVTKTVTSTVPGGTATVTSTVPGGTATVTTTVPGGTGVQTVTVTKTVEVPSGAGPVGLTEITFTLNGRVYTRLVDDSWDLQYFLHDIMGFIEIKTFCYRGACGSCSVIMNGRPILSCTTLAVNADGAVIETSRGIAMSGHPLVNAYIKNHCMQCGYCTPGFLVTSKALLDRNPNPSEEEIMEALSGNICRCGTYPAHIWAIQEAVAEGGM
jgi:aerobic-type carbon monoxide dehydrogenase small subunit (CoxS/CutS family)